MLWTQHWMLGAASAVALAPCGCGSLAALVAAVSAALLVCAALVAVCRRCFVSALVMALPLLGLGLGLPVGAVGKTACWCCCVVCVLPLMVPSQVSQRRFVVAYAAVAEANRACWCCFACACVVHLSFVHLGCHVVVETVTVTVVAAVVSLAQVNAACALGEVAARRPHLHR